MQKLHATLFGLAKITDYLEVHDCHFLQVQDKLWSVILHLLFQFRDVFGLKIADQANRGLAVSRTLFNLQSQFASIDRRLLQLPYQYD